MAEFWRPAYVAIGSNLSSPIERVHEAFERLASIESRALLRSRLYRAQPMGPQDQPEYVNAAAGFLTKLPPRALLEELLGIERTMGRVRERRWGARVIDLDLVWLVGGASDEAGLKVPHPGVSSRNFVLYPLSDIAPNLQIPGLGRVDEMKRAVGDAGISVI
ncbi:MAG TPA: 2-amino-4-hydroxy-6-hydroxymethyldihydropteridine diphosphokinase [Steroidobacteraceae bacterium]|jgi:2-amino-4-hydroxy-6-hydroxymethyldihydropteridine diphosphokinase